MLSQLRSVPLVASAQNRRQQRVSPTLSVVAARPARVARRGASFAVRAGGAQQPGKSGQTPAAENAEATNGAAAGPSKSDGELSMDQKLQAIRTSQKTAQPEGDDSESAGQASTTEKLGILDGALAEAKLIDWPTIPSIAGSTAVVVALVLASTALLLFVNASLNTISEQIFL